MTKYTDNKLQRLQSCKTGDVVLGPEDVAFGLINMCQLRCVNCWYWSPWSNEINTTPGWQDQFMDKELCFRVFDELAELEVEKVLLAGQGEPFLHPDLLEIVAYAEKVFKKLSVTSNGLGLTEKKINKLADILGPKDRINISVSAASAESYSAYHHGSNAKVWQRLLKNLKILSQADLDDFRIFQVINNTNYHEIEEMIALSAELKSTLSFKFASIPDGTEQFQLTSEQINYLRDNLPKWRKLSDDAGIEVNWDIFAGQLRDDHHFPIEEVGCYSGYMYSRVEADGSVYFCCRTDEVFKVGNVKDTPFKDIWFHSKGMKDFRAQMRQQNYLKECQSCLNWGSNFYTNNLLQKLAGTQ